MELGKYYSQNDKKLVQVNDQEWKVALKKCKNHIEWKLKAKTISGAHSASVLGGDPVEHYLGVAYEKLLAGDWEWKDEYGLAEQMIRIIDSQISKQVEKAETRKAHESQVVYMDMETGFYDIADAPLTPREEIMMDAQLQAIEKAIDGDDQLLFIVEALKEGKKRAEIAELLDITLGNWINSRRKLKEGS
ncbi:sigma-70 family RNA polymerase sigma factor [Pseudobacter ginsenosidimutans]|uniref:sigma-70 family RNA polymerase sigma factor n=1 Tax=Pseudobacter ginsenosidimutans TaxID=661488 RepID=UPI0011BBCCDC|nr:sigma-70 family RNA polymerase sigma factor [Pseudobacter ginsenosidimutans]QEC40238.1 sigma-70 family RNA polymerase sigma factor [Pseudobacter ginsenosidimutans]